MKDYTKIKLLNINNEKFIVDSDLAKICSTSTKRINFTRKRNPRNSTAFQVSFEEMKILSEDKVITNKRNKTALPWVYSLEEALSIARIVTKPREIKYKEKGFEEEVIKQLNLESWNLEKRQLILNGLAVDLLFSNKQNEILIVEVQVGQLDRYHLYKTLEYRDLYFLKYGVKPKVFVVAESIPKFYFKIAKIHNISLRCINCSYLYDTKIINDNQKEILRQIEDMFS